MNTLKLNKGDKIQVVNDSILKCMGIEKATGVVFSLRPDGSCCGFQCDQTGKIECFDDGDVTVVESIKPTLVKDESDDKKVTLSLKDLSLIKNNGFWSILYQVFMTKIKSVIETKYPFLKYSDTSDEYPSFWIDLPKAFNLDKDFKHTEALNIKIGTLIEKLKFKNFSFEHSICTADYVDTLSPSFDIANYETSLRDILSDCQLIADTISNVEIVPFGLALKNGTEGTKYDHTDTAHAMFDALKTISNKILNIPNCEETALNEAKETLKDLESHRSDIDWLTDKLTQANIDYKNEKDQKIYVIENDKMEIFYDEKSFLDRKKEIESYGDGQNIENSCHVYENESDANDAGVNLPREV